MKATQFKVIINGNYKGNSFKYEETVPAKAYQTSGFWLKFMPQAKREQQEQLNNAQVGQKFQWHEKDCDIEILAA